MWHQVCKVHSSLEWGETIFNLKKINEFGIATDFRNILYWYYIAYHGIFTCISFYLEVN